MHAYYRLVKPGIIYGNSLNVVAGFLLAAGVARNFDVWRLLAVLVGSALIIGAGCVFNNYIDRGIDHKMARTKARALVTGTLSVRAALLYGAVLLVAGFLALYLFTNAVTVLVGATGFIFYVVFYSLGKRYTVHGTLIGSVSGAIPPVAGYTAMAGEINAGAIILFLILVTWQMPHFYAIAMYRLEDYASAGLPVWPVKKGMHSTKVQIVVYVVAFIIACCLMTAYGYTGIIYLLGAVGLGVVWLIKALRGFRAQDDAQWSRKMFFFSLIVTLGIDLLLSVGALLP
jgi:protoheme IX farnesyltransferase